MHELEVLLSRLKMEHLSYHVESLLEQAAKKELNYREFLCMALQQEWNGRHQRGMESRLKQARLPWVKTLEQFDFTFQPGIDRKVVRELAGLAFVERSENVILLGPPGAGKTHLAIALGVKAVDAGHRVLFMPLDRLIATLMKAKQENRLERQLQQLSYARVLILDEIGYLPMNREEASLFFRLLNRRYEKASIILTSNKGVAVEHYLNHGCCLAFTSRTLGYPCTDVLARWVNERYPDRRRIFTSKTNPVAPFEPEVKRQAVMALCTRQGSASEIARRIGVSRAVLYKWKDEIIGNSAYQTMRKHNAPSLEAERDALREEVARLNQEIRRRQMELDILKKAEEIIKKDPGISISHLNNREKTKIIDALRQTYPLTELLRVLGLARSSYFCHRFNDYRTH